MNAHDVGNLYIDFLARLGFSAVHVWGTGHYIVARPTDDLDDESRTFSFEFDPLVWKGEKPIDWSALRQACDERVGTGRLAPGGTVGNLTNNGPTEIHHGPFLPSTYVNGRQTRAYRSYNGRPLYYGPAFAAVLGKYVTGSGRLKEALDDAVRALLRFGIIYAIEGLLAEETPDYHGDEDEPGLD